LAARSLSLTPWLPQRQLAQPRRFAGSDRCRIFFRGCCVGRAKRRLNSSATSSRFAAFGQHQGPGRPHHDRRCAAHRDRWRKSTHDSVYGQTTPPHPACHSGRHGGASLGMRPAPTSLGRGQEHGRAIPLRRYRQEFAPRRRPRSTRRDRAVAADECGDCWKRAST
jgi:hypothetical protein